MAFQGTVLAKMILLHDGSTPVEFPRDSKSRKEIEGTSTVRIEFVCDKLASIESLVSTLTDTAGDTKP
jgi:hypothetical protein